MRTTHKLMIVASAADALFKTWRNQGWEPTVATVSGKTCVVYIDLVTDKGVDPLQHKNILQVIT